LCHEFEQCAAADGLALHGLAVGVDAMHTEDVLGQIDTDGGDLSHDCLLYGDVPDWHIDVRTTRGGAGCGSPYHSLGRR